MDRVLISVIVAGKSISVDCSIYVSIKDILDKLHFKNGYIYSLFNDCYYDVNKVIKETKIRSGDILFL